MKVWVYNRQRAISLSTHSVKPIVQEVLLQEKCSTDEVSISFVSKKKISSLHNLFFQDPSPTDCISLPIDGTTAHTPHVLGEIFICPEVAYEYVSKKKKANLYEEITLYLIHGLLHLVGYDDIDPSDRRRMRRAEKKHLSNLARKALILKSK